MFENLRKIRQQHGVTCEQLSCLLGFKTRGAYQKKEMGNVPFTLAEAKIIADFFNKDMNNIFFENKLPKPQ